MSYGCVDLERASDEELATLPQLWVPGMPFLATAVQEKLLRYARGGGHLVMTPWCPRTDEAGAPSRELWDVALADVAVHEPDARTSPEAMSMLNTPQGESIVAPGPVTLFDLPPDAEVLVRTVDGESPCGFTRPAGRGSVTLLGFRLQYVPNEQEDQLRFLAMQLDGEAGGFVCLVNPVDLPGGTSFDFTPPPAGDRRRTVPELLPSIGFERRGARLLPVELKLGEGLILQHSTWELIGTERDSGRIGLTFDAPPAGDGEVAVRGGRLTQLENGSVREERSTEGSLVLVVRSTAEWCRLTFEAAKD